jgi:RNA polymerase sigma-70 factor (ECF subfamily)
MQRYAGAVYRYLLGAVRDKDVATELFQEFALRFVRGDLRRADPARGRFRNYVKVAIIHLVSDYYRSRRNWPQPLPDDFALPIDHTTSSLDPDDRFVDSWREELVSRTWAAMAVAHPALHAALVFHLEHPEIPSPGVADRLTADLGKRVTPTNARVMLHRAREKFGDLLVEEVAQTLDSPTQDELSQELSILRLDKLCAAALKRRRARA